MNRVAHSLTPSMLVLLLATVALLSFGQVLFKQASPHVSVTMPMSLLSPVLLAALAIYGVATLAWLAVLARVPLSVAFPFYGLGFVLVPILSWLILNEPIRWQTLAGSAVIVVGISITSLGGAR